MNLGAPLSHENVARKHDLAAKALGPETLTRRIASVARRAACFLVCHDTFLTRVYLGDLHAREMLPMTAFAMRVLPPLLLEGNDLLAASMFQDFGLDCGASDQRSACLGRVASQKQDLFEPERFTHFAIEPVDGDHLVASNPVLLSATTDDRKHWKNP